MIFLDPADPRTKASVIKGSWCGGEPPVVNPTIVDDEDDGTAILALELASELLMKLSGYLVHPAGEAVEDFMAYPRTHRLTPNWRPIRHIVSVKRIYGDLIYEELFDSWCIIGQDIYFNKSQCDYTTWYRDTCSCEPLRQELLQVGYRFGSTITASARRAVLFLAHQLWLECHPEMDEECQLPERTTSVNREGLSYTIFDPQGFLDQRRTGIPSIDLWLTTANPSKALRPSGVWTPDSPPAVNYSMKWVRPDFPVINPLEPAK